MSDTIMSQNMYIYCILYKGKKTLVVAYLTYSHALNSNSIVHVNSFTLLTKDHQIMVG